MSQTRSLLPTPPQLVNNGRFNLGAFKEPILEINPLDATLLGDVPIPRLLKNLRLKEWEHFGLVHQDHYLSLALFNAKNMALVQVCLYQRKQGTIQFYERKTFPWAVQIPADLRHSQAEYHGHGFYVRIRNRLQQGHFQIQFDIAASKQLPAIMGEFTCFEKQGRDEPLVVCLPLGSRTAMYSHKLVCALQGEMTLQGERVEFSKAQSYALVDIHKGFYPFAMKWHWACGGGYDGQGKLIGFNLTDNQVLDQERYNENAFWSDGRLRLLPPVKFTFDKSDPLRPWVVRDQQGCVELYFTPEVMRTVDINLLLLRSRYRGPFGSFSGRLRSQDGEEQIIENCFGMCEDFYLRS